MRRVLNSFFVIWLAGIMTFLIDPALSVGREDGGIAISSSPLFCASLEESLSSLSSQHIDISLDVSESPGTMDEARSANSEPVLHLAQYTSGETCMGSGGATCQGTATCGVGKTCGGGLTCGATCYSDATCQESTTCRGSKTCFSGLTCGGSATCQAAATCVGKTCKSGLTCAGPMCVVSPAQ